MSRVVVATGFGGPEVLSVIDVDVSAPGPGEATVEVKAAGINPVDYKMYSGMMGADPDALPMRLGFEAAGVVTAVGDDAGEVTVGDEVIAYRVNGGYGAEITVPVSILRPKPATLSWEQAAGLTLAGVTAYHLLEATGVGDGDTVLIHGASGGVGRIAAQLAVLRGAAVIGTAGERRHDELRSLGVVPVVYGDGLTDRVRSAAPDGVDVALDAIGTDEAVDASLQLVSDKARIATIAAFGRASDDGIKALGGGPGADPGEAVRARGREVLHDLAAADELDIVVAESFPLDAAVAAHELVRGGHAGGKVVLIP